MSKRTCANQRCGNTFTPHRPHQRFCGSACRFEAWWATKRENGREKPGQRVVEGARRRSRDGLGTKVYLTFAEIVHFQQLRDRADLPATPAGQRLDLKLARAAERINNKGENR